jgi:hypothetical protein
MYVLYADPTEPLNEALRKQYDGEDMTTMVHKRKVGSSGTVHKTCPHILSYSHTYILTHTRLKLYVHHLKCHVGGEVSSVGEGERGKGGEGRPQCTGARKEGGGGGGVRIGSCK